MKKLLLHICCAPCSTHAMKTLTGDFEIAGFFYNPNVFPLQEYKLRLETAKKLSADFDFELIECPYDFELWNSQVLGLENEPEGGKRCDVCFEFRLNNTAQYAAQNGFDIFATTLTISPHKDAEKINSIGNKISEKYGIEFLSRDFKKNNGFANSIKISKEHNLYRQNYCGCAYSLRMART